MKIKVFLFLILFLLFTFEGINAVSQRDPFVSLLPQPEKTKATIITPVEQKKSPHPVYVKGGTGELASIRLEGIVWIEKNPAAIINGDVYKKGDEIEKGAKISNIRKNEVYIYYKDRIHIFSIKNTVELEVK